MYRVENNTEDYFYLHRDYLGSITSITDSEGKTLEKRHFNAWGEITKYWNAQGQTTIPAEGILLDRGYTGHEHLLGVGLIHMNGRLYDPVLHRFLQPDNYIQDPFNTQNFNRYGYGLNNPFKYIDPDGEFIITALIVGAVVGAYVGGSQANGTFNPLKWDYGSVNTWIGIGGGALVGGISGGAGAYVGGVVSSGALLSSTIGGAVGGAISGAGYSVLPGGSGDPLKGALIGTLSGATGSLFGALGAKYIGGVVVNGFKISSPVLKGAITGTLGGVAGGYTGGFMGGLLQTGDFSKAHQAGLGGLKMGWAIGMTSGAFSGYKYAKSNDLNPWTGRNRIEEFAYNNNIFSDNKGKVYPEIVKKYMTQMENGTFDAVGGGYKYDNKIIFSEGNHRMNAAIKYYFKTGDDTYINLMLNSSQFELRKPIDIYPFKALKK